MLTIWSPSSWPEMKTYGHRISWLWVAPLNLAIHAPIPDPLTMLGVCPADPGGCRSKKRIGECSYVGADIPSP